MTRLGYTAEEIGSQVLRAFVVRIEGTGEHIKTTFKLSW